MSDAEIRREYGRLKGKYGPEVAREAFPEVAKELDPNDESGGDGVSSDSSPSQPGLIENVTRVDSWDHHYDVSSDQTGLLLAETDHYLNLYESDELDGDGKKVYFWKTLDYSDAVDEGWYAATTDNMDSDLDLRTTELDHVQHEPQSTEYFGGSGQYFEISVGPATVGSNFGASKGYEEPDPGRVEYGNGGRFAYEVGGRIPDLTTGSMIVDTRSDGYWEFYWETYVRASSGV